MQTNKLKSQAFLTSILYIFLKHTFEKINIMSNMDKYEKICDIGKGSFGCVSKIKRKADGKTLVWKELNYGKMSEKEK